MVEARTDSYRPEIDGLRAIAILSVLGFHVGFSDWKGGFVGVDVFFVLSGYLICGQIHQSLLRGDFVIADFFARRIRRLSTAAFVCFLITAIAGWVLFVPFELPALAKNLTGSATFINNWLLMGDTGYFATGAVNNPFLHTWSLAIEEQFYILLPLIVAITRRNAKAFVRVLVATFLLSVALTVFSGDQLFMREERYFSSVLRVWELALGGLIAVAFANRTLPRLPLAPLAGLLAILAPVFLIDDSVLHPGPWAILVTAGTALLLVFGSPQASWTGRVLAMRAPRYLGRISYGTYLWHWPLIVYYEYTGGDLSDVTRTLFVLIAFALGAASHHLVEKPMHRLALPQRRKQLFAVLVAQTSVLLCLALAIGQAARWADPKEEAAFRTIIDNMEVGNEHWTECWFNREKPGTCTFGPIGSDKRAILLWGDSMANSAFHAFDQFARQRDLGGTLVTSPSCVPIADILRDGSSLDACSAARDFAVETLAQSDATEI